MRNRLRARRVVASYQKKIAARGRVIKVPILGKKTLGDKANSGYVRRVLNAVQEDLFRLASDKMADWTFEDTANQIQVELGAWNPREIDWVYADPGVFANGENWFVEPENQRKKRRLLRLIRQGWW